jgi:O-antigen/teichoic acid export membrane protein
LEEVNKLQDKPQRRLLSRTLTDYLLYFPALTVSGLVGLVTVAVLSKYFSPADYGHDTLAFSTLLLLSIGNRSGSDLPANLNKILTFL